jgi:tetratricopeptide (TPR) repeat protein
VSPRSAAEAALVGLVLVAAQGCKKPGDDVAPKVKADGHYVAGMAAYLKGDFAAAHTEFAEVRALDPQNPRLAAAEGEVYLSEGKIAEAIGLFEQATKSDPGRATNWTRLGYLYSLRPEDRARAPAILDKALGLNPKDYNAHEVKADLFFAEEKLGEAVKEWTLASDFAPEGARSEIVLKATAELMKKDRTPDALALLERSVKAGIKSPEVLTELGDRLVEANRMPEAVEAYSGAAKANPKDPTLWELVGELEAKLGHPAEAEAALQASLKVEDRAVVHVGLARLCQAKKDDACVGKQLDAALATAKGIELRETLDLADLLSGLGRKKDALSLLMTVSEEAEQKGNRELQLKTARLAHELKDEPAEKAACVRAVGGQMGVKCP